MSNSRLSVLDVLLTFCITVALLAILVGVMVLAPEPSAKKPEAAVPVEQAPDLTESQRERARALVAGEDAPEPELPAWSSRNENFAFALERQEIPEGSLVKNLAGRTVFSPSGDERGPWFWRYLRTDEHGQEAGARALWLQFKGKDGQDYCIVPDNGPPVDPPPLPGETVPDFIRDAPKIHDWDSAPRDAKAEDEDRTA